MFQIGQQLFNQSGRKASDQSRGKITVMEIKSSSAWGVAYRYTKCITPTIT